MGGTNHVAVKTEFVKFKISRSARSFAIGKVASFAGSDKLLANGQLEVSPFAQSVGGRNS